MDGTTPTFCEASSAPDSVEARLARHDRLVYYAVNRYIRARPDLKDDILAVARAALAEALETYRADVGFAFSTYALHQMQWSASRFLREFTRHDHTTASLDEARGEDEDGALTLTDTADEQNAAREQSEATADENLLKRIHSLREALAACTTLTAGEREILNAFLESGNCVAVAASLEFTPQRVSQALSSATAKLRKHLHILPAAES